MRVSETKFRRTRIVWDAAKAAEAYQMFLSGSNVTQVAAHFGVSTVTARRELHNNGYTLKRTGLVDEQTRAQILALYADGCKIRQIGRMIHRDDLAVSQALQAGGVELRGRHTGQRLAEPVDDDAEPMPPRWAVVAYRRRVAAGMPDDVARKMSHLTHYQWSAVEAALQRVPVTM